MYLLRWEAISSFFINHNCWLREIISCYIPFRCCTSALHNQHTGVTICYIDGLFLCGDGGSRDCYTIILKDAHGLTVEDMWLEEISHLIMQFHVLCFSCLHQSLVWRITFGSIWFFNQVSGNLDWGGTLCYSRHLVNFFHCFSVFINKISIILINK